MRFAVPGFLLCVLLVETVNGQSTLPAIGHWREHLPYHSAIAVATGSDHVITATPYALFTVDPSSREISRLNKINGLTETGVQSIFYDISRSQLLIAYDDSNIDLVRGDNIENIPGLFRETISGNKQIYGISAYGNLYYLATGLGILQLDPEKAEFRDAWYIGPNGGTLPVYSVAQSDEAWFAATDSGLKYCPRAANPADYQNWTTTSIRSSLKTVRSNGNRVFALANDSLFAGAAGQWELLYEDDWPILDFFISEGQLILCERKTDGSARVLLLSDSGIIEKNYQQPGVISLPRAAVMQGDNLWVADEFGGLSVFYPSGAYDRYIPDGPEGIATATMKAVPDQVVVASGSVNSAWNYQYNGDGVYVFDNKKWKRINRYQYPQLDSMLDFISVAIDPRDKSIWAGSFGGGLLHADPTGEPVQIYKMNSALSPAVGDPGSYRVSGLAFDQQNNLWVSNYGAPQPLLLLQPNGQWLSFAMPFSISENAVATLLIDDAQQVWIVAPKGNGLFVYNHGESLASTADDKWKHFTAAGADGLPGNDVRCIVKDRSGFVWIGTDNGMAVMPCAAGVFSNTGCRIVWPVVKTGAFAGYLFKGESINDIAIDGADHKWVATDNGVWELSPDAETVIRQFTAANSQLLNDRVFSITIEPGTGELFFATASGICSFRGVATDALLPVSGATVYPNPVPPGYSGTIGIRGLPENATVKIIDPAGRLVYQTKAAGGQAEWNGKDYQGRTVASGVYLVIGRKENGTDKQVAKIIFIAQ